MTDTWEPITWTPSMFEGASWGMAAELKGGSVNDIIGAALFINGQEYPVEVGDGRLSFELSADEVDAIPHRAPCSLYIDSDTKGRWLWLNGSITKVEGATQ